MSGGQQKVSYSQLNTFRECPQKWHYGYVQGYQRDETELARVELEFGIWWAALRAADRIERGRRLDTIKKVPKSLSVGDGPTSSNIPTDQGHLVLAVMEAAQRANERMPHEAREMWADRLGEELPDRLSNLDHRYHLRWAEEEEREEPIAVEVGWGRDIGHNTRLGGYVDYVYRDRLRNLVVVRDDKTGKSLGQQSSADDLMDSQLSFYAWGLSPQVAEWGLGPIKATSYDRVRSVAPKTPVLTAAGALSKSITDYDALTYRQWAQSGPVWGTEGETYKTGKRAGEPKWGTYVEDPAITERLSSPAETAKWFQRTLTPVNLNLVRAHLRAATESSRYMRDIREMLANTGEAPRNFGRACKFCDFAKLCRAQMFGGPDGEYAPEDYGLRLRR